MSSKDARSIAAGSTEKANLPFLEWLAHSPSVGSVKEGGLPETWEKGWALEALALAGLRGREGSASGKPFFPGR